MFDFPKLKYSHENLKCQDIERFQTANEKMPSLLVTPLLHGVKLLLEFDFTLYILYECLE